MSGLYRKAKSLVPAVTAIFLLSVCIAFGQSKATKAEQEAKKPSGTPSEALAAAPFTPHAPAHDLTGSDVEAFLDAMMPSPLHPQNLPPPPHPPVTAAHPILPTSPPFATTANRTPL